MLLSLTNDLDYDLNCLSKKNDSAAYYFLFNIKGIVFIWYIKFIWLKLNFKSFNFKFGFSDDPFENNNIASVYPCKLKELEIRLEEYKKEMVPPLILEPPNFSSNSNPEVFGDKWLPGWCTLE